MVCLCGINNLSYGNDYFIKVCLNIVWLMVIMLCDWRVKMTNAEKFKELFGIDSDMEFCPVECEQGYVGEWCPFYEELVGSINK